jgi:hypothetical protein
MRSCCTGRLAWHGSGDTANHSQCCSRAERLAQHPPEVCTRLTYPSIFLTHCRNSVDKRTVIENYDLVVCTQRHNHTLISLTWSVPRSRRARRRRHHPRDRPRRRRVACQQAPGARHELDEEHRPLGARLPKRVGVWKAAACREDTAGSMSILDKARRWRSFGNRNAHCVWRLR